METHFVPLISSVHLARAAGGAPRAGMREPGGARARIQRRGHARPLSFTFTLTAGVRGMGLLCPPSTYPSSHPPKLSCPDACLGRRGGVGGEEVQRRSERRDSRALSAVMSTASAASSPHHLHPGCARAAARGNLGVEKQKACGCPEPPTPFANMGETGSGPAALPQLRCGRRGRRRKGRWAQG